jgi:hypothetical protein
VRGGSRHIVRGGSREGSSSMRALCTSFEVPSRGHCTRTCACMAARTPVYVMGTGGRSRRLDASNTPSGPSEPQVIRRLRGQWAPRIPHQTLRAVKVLCQLWLLSLPSSRACYRGAASAALPAKQQLLLGTAFHILHWQMHVTCDILLLDAPLSTARLYP